MSTPADPHCMNCRHVWNREFLDEHATRSWMEGEFRKRREAVLFDREKSRLPVTQEAVEVEREKRRITEKRNALRKRRIEIKRELTEIEERLADIRHFTEHGNWPVTVTITEGATGPKKETRQFVAACPSATCRGFLNTAYVCGVCEGKFCPACREPKPSDSEHTCDPSLVATIKAITADSRTCPSCGTAISRVSGCDQMYCTQCDTAFSYTTGKVVEGVIHNPHYFERLAKLKKESATTATVVGGCNRNGWPDWYRAVHASQGARFLNAKGFERNLQGLYRIGLHIQEVVLPEYPTHATPVSNVDARIHYLMGEIEERRFRQLLQQRDRTRQRDLEIRAPLELAVVTILEFFVWLTQQKIGADDVEKKATVEARLKQLHEFLEKHINTSLRDIADRYGNSVPIIQNLSDLPKYETYGYKRITVNRPRSKAVTSLPSLSPHSEEKEGSVIEHH